MRVSPRGKETKNMSNADTSDPDTTVPEQGANLAPAKTASKKSTSKATKGAKKAKAKTAAKKLAKRKAGHPKAKGKGARILEMIGRTQGATLAEIMKATDWQAHSVRGFLSTAAGKHHLKIESAKNEAGDRTYRVVK
jgi:hypothetical protein